MNLQIFHHIYNQLIIIHILHTNKNKILEIIIKILIIKIIVIHHLGQHIQTMINRINLLNLIILLIHMHNFHLTKLIMIIIHIHINKNF